jgi:error-prone DNA polymerase
LSEPSARGLPYLHVHSPYSFCDGAAAARDLVLRAAEHGAPALALTDHHSLSGAVRWHKLCRGAGLKPIFGAEVAMEDGGHLTLLARTRRGYANLCGLLTDAHLGHERREPAVAEDSLARWSEDVLCLSGCRRGPLRVLVRAGRHAEAESYARLLLAIFGPDRFFLELHRDLYPGELSELGYLSELAGRLGIEAVAAHNVHFADRAGFRVHDVLTCIRTHVGIDEPHPSRPANAERWLKPPADLARLFRRFPDALASARRLADICEDYDLSGPEYVPHFPAAAGATAPMLRDLAYRGARDRYGALPADLRDRLDHELAIIEEMGFVEYFLIVWDAVRFARREGIRYSGRGSCADSVVAYSLGLTHVDAWRRRLRFERFINPARINALPDIDVDFDARRRDDVAAYVVDRYGHEHVAAVCTFQCFRARGALREVAKIFGVPEATVDRAASVMPWLSAAALPEAIERLPELRDSGVDWDRLCLVVEMAAALDGLPRHIGTHLGGVVISARPLTTISPLQLSAKGVRIISFDKEDVEDLGLFKLDLLSLRTLGAVDDAVAWSGADYDGLPLDDASTYEMLRGGEAVGAFQLESPAQRSLHQRLKPTHYEDLVASVAIIRPGPVQANMVAPFIARRRGEEPVVFTDPRVEAILGKTYGVVLYQEQVLELAIDIAGFTPGEADQLRRLMTHHRDREAIDALAAQFIERALANSAEREVAEMAFNAIRSFAGYGFCEGHAAAFADIGYRTSYLLRHHAAEFYAALLNNQPMGFYPPHTLVNEARRRSVRVLPLDLNESGRDFFAGVGWLRVALKQVKGISEAELDALVAARAERPFTGLDDLLARVPVQIDTAESLILAGAFDALEPNRRALLWRLYESASGQGRLALQFSSPVVDDFPPEEKLLHEWDILGFCRDGHPLGLLRPGLRRQGVLDAERAKRSRSGRLIRVAGLAIRPHRPPTRSGKTVVFLTLEDETGLIDVTVFEPVYRKYASVLFGSSVLMVEGRMQRSHGLAVIATHLSRLSLSGEMKKPNHPTCALRSAPKSPLRKPA